MIPHNRAIDRLMKDARDHLRSSKGAFDLPSILVGVVVVAILTAGVLAVIFGVIPFAQDHGAKQDLDAIVKAEGVAKTAGTSQRFVDDAGLAAAGYLTSGAGRAAAADTAGSCFAGLTKSGSGKLFVRESTGSVTTELTNDVTTTCVDERKLRTMITAVGADASKRPLPGPDSVVLTPKSEPGRVPTMKIEFVPFQESDPYVRFEYRLNGGEWVRAWDQVSSGGTAILDGALSATIDVRLYTLTHADGPWKDNGFTQATAHFEGPVPLLQNASFESGTANWTITGGAGEIQNAPWWGGVNNYLIIDQGQTASQSFPVVPGQAVTASTSILSSVPDVPAALQFFDAAGNEISRVDRLLPNRTVLAAGVQTPMFNNYLVIASSVPTPAGAVTANITFTAIADNTGLNDVLITAWR